MTDPLRQAVADAMVRAHGISRFLADYHAGRMEEAELVWRFSRYVGLGFAVGVGARPPGIRRGKDDSGRDGGTRTQPDHAIAVRSPSGGGGGGVDLAVAFEAVQ